MVWDKLVQAGLTRMLGTVMTGQVVGCCLACWTRVFVEQEDEVYAVDLTEWSCSVLDG
jgi:hypothetical protein